MEYNFDQQNNRRNTNSYKWDSTNEEDIIPLWVADMDFKTAPAIIEALRKRVEQGIFGYTKVPDAYYEATVNWFKNKHGWEFSPEDMIYTSGVVPAISAIIKTFTTPGDKVIVQTPVYNCFFSSIKNNGCHPLENRLIYKDNTYYIDFEDLEIKARNSNAKLMLLCNPHNPAGRVWTKEELSKIRDICGRNGVLVVSDEIHCELVYPPYKYTPYATVCGVSDPWVICVSPSKAFNIAGLQIANIITKTAGFKARIDRSININEVCDVNPFGVLATIAAYNEGEGWLQALIGYLKENYDYLVDFFNKRLPRFPVLKLEGTYLVWVDCRSLGFPSHELEDKLLKEGKVWLNAGDMYGEAGEGFMRINIATNRSQLREGLERLENVLNSLSLS